MTDFIALGIDATFYGSASSTMTTARRLHYSYDDYLGALEQSELKLEYCDGDIYAMAGGTPMHAELGARAIKILSKQLTNTCSVYTSDLKIRIEASDLTTFPDVTVVCGKREVSPIDSNAVTNPTLLVEVTSRSTEDYDRGDKLSHYKQISSLAGILIVSHRRAQLSLFQRTANTWVESTFRLGETAQVLGAQFSISVDELYAGVTLETA